MRPKCAHPAHDCPSAACETCEVRDTATCAVLAPDELEQLADIRTVVPYAKGQTILREGERADFLFNIRAGAAKLYKLLPDGRCQITGFLFAGDFLGLAHQDSYAYSAEALSTLELCRFPRDRFEAFAIRLPKLEHRLLTTAVDELAAAQEQMLLLGRKSAVERLGSFLVQLSRRAARRGQPDSPVEVPMTRAEIADYLGLTTETVSRVITRLKTSGVIRVLGQHRIAILDPRRLLAAAEGMAGEEGRP